MTPLEIAREVFPDKSEEHLQEIIDRYTTYPLFWNPRDRERSEANLRRELKEAKKNLKKFIRVEAKTRS